jgi:hypothetical protein
MTSSCHNIRLLRKGKGWLVSEALKMECGKQKLLSGSGQEMSKSGQESPFKEIIFRGKTRASD